MSKIEAVARIIARENGGSNYTEDDWGVFVYQANKIITALEKLAA